LHLFNNFFDTTTRFHNRQQATKKDQAEDNVSAPSSFIANAHNELQGGPKKWATSKLSKNRIKTCHL